MNDKVALENHDENDIKKSEKLALYSRTIAMSTSRGLVQPFVSMIALTMGASSGLLGWIQSISNLLSTFLSPFFGRLSDIVKRRKPFRCHYPVRNKIIKKIGPCRSCQA